MTLHHDAPIAGIEMLNVAWAAVNRVTSSGQPLGPEERITAFEAFRAITADAAWQNFEEHHKGTLETGKLADLVILFDDPLKIDPMAIKDIRVLQTIKEGQTVYVAKTIVTLDPVKPSVTAVAVVGDRILDTGSLEKLKAIAGDQPYKVDNIFADKVIVPGFIARVSIGRPCALRVAPSQVLLATPETYRNREFALDDPGMH